MDAAACRLSTTIGATADLEPLAAVVRAKGPEQTSTVASLQTMGEGGWWTQSRLFEAGLVTSNLCQACLESEGTFLHRCVGCSKRAERRKAYGNGEEAAQDIIKKRRAPSARMTPLQVRNPSCQTENCQATP